jgi:hypothetical protein
MTIRTGHMDVRLPNESGLAGGVLHQRLAEAVGQELEKSGERLVRLIGQHWTGFAEGPLSPWMTYKSVGYEAAPQG